MSNDKPIQPYTQVEVRGKNASDTSWMRILPVNIPYTPNHKRAQNHPEVVARVNALKKMGYDIVEAFFRDMDV